MESKRRPLKDCFKQPPPAFVLQKLKDLDRAADSVMGTIPSQCRCLSANNLTLGITGEDNEENFGRLFGACSLAKGERCGFFWWGDPPNIYETDAPSCPGCGRKMVPRLDGGKPVWGCPLSYGDPKRCKKTLPREQAALPVVETPTQGVLTPMPTNTQPVAKQANVWPPMPLVCRVIPPTDTPDTDIIDAASRVSGVLRFSKNNTRTTFFLGFDDVKVFATYWNDATWPKEIVKPLVPTLNIFPNSPQGEYQALADCLSCGATSYTGAGKVVFPDVDAMVKYIVQYADLRVEGYAITF